MELTEYRAGWEYYLPQVAQISLEILPRDEQQSGKVGCEKEAQRSNCLLQGADFRHQMQTVQDAQIQVERPALVLNNHMNQWDFVRYL